MRHPFKLVAAAAAALMLFTGCSSSDSPAENTSSAEATASASAAPSATGPRTVTDHGDKTVEVPAEINRVVFEQIPLMSTFVAFHDGEAPGLIGASNHLRNAIDGTILADRVPSVIEVDTSFDNQGIPNGESVAALNPDVVFNNAFNEQNSQILDSAGLTRVGFKTMGAPTETYVEWFRLLEDVYGTPGKTDKKIEEGQKIVADAQQRAGSVPEGEKAKVMIVMGAGQGQMRVAGAHPGWFTESWADRMNFTNVTAAEKQSVVPVNVEQIAAWDPDVILITGEGMSNMTAKDILDNKVEGMDLSHIRAVKERKVYSTRLGMWNWFTPNPDAPLVAMWMGSKMYPEKFADVDLESMTKDFYKLTYTWDITDAEAKAILDPDA